MHHIPTTGPEAVRHYIDTVSCAPSHVTPEQAARLAQNFEQMNQRRSVNRVKPVIRAWCIVVAIAIAGVLIGAAVLGAAPTTAHHIAQPFAGNPY